MLPIHSLTDNMGSYEVRFVPNWFNHKSTDGWKTNQLIKIRFCSTIDASNISWLKTVTKHIVNWNEQGTGDGCNIIRQGYCQEDQASVEIERIKEEIIQSWGQIWNSYIINM